MSSFRILSIQWLEVDEADSIDEALRLGADEFYSLDEASREALPNVTVVVRLDDLEAARLDILSSIDRVLDLP